jgi:hypothetical protein
MVSKKKIKEGREKKLQLKDERTPEEKQKVIEMLQALQKRLLDDAQREDGTF